MNSRFLFVLVVAFILGGAEQSLRAAGKKAPSYFPGKKIIEVERLKNTRIEMPDHTFYSLGADLEAAVVTRLMNTGKYMVVTSNDDPDLVSQPKVQSLLELPETPPELDQKYRWSGTVVPSLKLRFQVNALNYRMGFCQDEQYFGFDENFSTSYNDGSGRFLNEYPAPEVFSGIYTPLFEFNADRYRSQIHMTVFWEIPNQAGESRSGKFFVEVDGAGFFFHFKAWLVKVRGGLNIAKRDALQESFREALDGAVDEIKDLVSPLPLLARVDALFYDDAGPIVLLGTGPFSKVPPGARYRFNQTVVEVIVTERNGSVGKVIQGKLEDLKVGDVLEQESTGAERQAIQEFQDKPPIRKVKLGEWRDWSCPIGLDQPYFPYLNGESRLTIPVRDQNWAKQIGMNSVSSVLVSSAEKRPVLVAVIDSGVDYNHPVLNHAIQKAPKEKRLTQGILAEMSLGWDFFNHDPRAFDDGGRGTQPASLLAAVAPNVKILPYKVFHDSGVTTSAAVLAAFESAVDNGAQIILCPWSSSVLSFALEAGIRYAHEHGVIVVTAAGDEGQNIDQVPTYPAFFAKNWDNVLVVGASDLPTSNFGPQSVSIASPGFQIRVAAPGLRIIQMSSTSLSSAIAAGVLVRNWYSNDESAPYQIRIHQLLEESVSLPELGSRVQGGRRVRVLR